MEGNKQFVMHHNSRREILLGMIIGPKLRPGKEKWWAWTFLPQPTSRPNKGNKQQTRLQTVSLPTDQTKTPHCRPLFNMLMFFWAGFWSISAVQYIERCIAHSSRLRWPAFRNPNRSPILPQNLLAMAQISRKPKW